MIFRLVIFSAKVLSITKPCSPLATRDFVWWPLMLLAATELAMGDRFGWSGTGILGAAHVIFLLCAMKLGGEICERDVAGLHDWGWAEEG
jgi:hypothetical protein